MKPLPIAVAALAGLAVGFFAGRTFAPQAIGAERELPAAQTATAESQSFPEGHADVAANGKDSRKGADRLQPLTFDRLMSELTRLESGNLTGAAALRELADLQERLKGSDLPSLVAAIAGSPGTNRDRGLGLVFAAYAEENPQAAWALALSVQNTSARRAALHSVASSMGRTNPEQALALAAEIKDADLRRSIRSFVLSTMAAKDPARAFTLATQSEDNSDQFFMGSVLAQWLRKDPQAAMAAAATLKGKQADQARMMIVSELARRDPQAAWEYASGLPSPPDDRSWLDPRMQVIQEWAQADPAKALSAALTIKETESRNQAIATAVNSWASSDFPGALDYAISIPDGGTRGRILQSLASNRNADRPRMFEALMEHAPAGESFQQAMSGLLGQWAQENPREAAAAVMQLPPGRSFAHVASSVANEWVSSGADKTEIFNWLRGLPEGNARDNTLNTLFSAWAKGDPTGALRALSSLKPEEKSNALQGIASGWSRTAPADTAAWVASLPSSPEKNSAMHETINAWARSSPGEAAAFVSRLPEEERTKAMEGMMQAWASRDTASAADWLQRQPAGRSKDAGLRTLSSQIAKEDPETALIWVNSISNQETRASQMERIAREWLRHDPASARKWIGNSPLLPEVRQKLLQ